MNLARHRTMAAAAAVAVALGITLTGATADTAEARTQNRVLTGKTNPVPALNQGESATFRVVDSGRSITITGTAKGMNSTTTYVSLIYPDAACSVTENPSSLTVDGGWQSHGNSRQLLVARYEGAAYKAVKGKIKSMSIRAITNVVIPPGNAGPATATLEPRACAPLK